MNTLRSAADPTPDPGAAHSGGQSDRGVEMGGWQVVARDYRAARRDRGGLSAASRQTARYILDDLAAWLDGVPAGGPRSRRPVTVGVHADADVIVEAVEKWLTSHRSWSASTRCTNLGFVRPFLEWAAGRGRVTGGVASQLKNPRKPRSLPRAQPDDAIATLLGVVPDARGRAIVLLMAQCGLRRAEVTTVIWPGDVNLAGATVLVRGKGDTERVVYLSAETLDALEVWLRERGPFPGPLICRLAGGRRFPVAVALSPTWVGILVSRWLTDAGLKVMPRDGVSAHALRHTAATRLLRDGVNVRVIQRMLGHANLATTEGYTRVEDADVRAAMAAVSYGSRRLRVVDGG